MVRRLAVVGSCDDDVARGKKRGTEVFESGSDDDWRIWHDLQSVAAVSQQQRGKDASTATGTFSDGLFGVRDGASERVAGNVAGALIDAAGVGWGSGAD